MSCNSHHHADALLKAVCLLVMYMLTMHTHMLSMVCGLWPDLA